MGSMQGHSINSKMVVAQLTVLLSSFAAQGLTTTKCLTECPNIYHPVCGSDGVTYGSSCVFDIGKCFHPNLTLKHLGACKIEGNECVKECSKVFFPVCASDGTTYGNMCVYNNEKCRNPGLKLRHLGTCGDISPSANSQDESSGLPIGGGKIPKCSKECPKIFLPLCGSDGKTYRNKCVFEIEKCLDPKLFIKHSGQCKEIEDFSSWFTPPTDVSLDEPTTQPTAEDVCLRECPKNYEPVCGTDNITYPNKCMLMNAICKNSQLQVKYPAHCSDDNDTRLMLAEWKNNNETNESLVKNQTYVENENDDQAIVDEAIKVPKDDPCLRKCPRNYEPVCGTDNITYPNMCVLMIGVCRNPELRVKHLAHCSHGHGSLSVFAGWKISSYNFTKESSVQNQNDDQELLDEPTQLPENSSALSTEWKVKRDNEASKSVAKNKSDNETSESDVKNESDEQVVLGEFIKLPKDDPCVMDCIQYFQPTCAQRNLSNTSSCEIVIKLCLRKNLRGFFHVPCTKENKIVEIPENSEDSLDEKESSDSSNKKEEKEKTATSFTFLNESLPSLPDKQKSEALLLKVGLLADEGLLLDTGKPANLSMSEEDDEFSVFTDEIQYDISDEFLLDENIYDESQYDISNEYLLDENTYDESSELQFESSSEEEYGRYLLQKAGILSLDEVNNSLNKEDIVDSIKQEASSKENMMRTEKTRDEIDEQLTIDDINNFIKEQVEHMIDQNYTETNDLAEYNSDSQENQEYIDGLLDQINYDTDLDNNIGEKSKKIITQGNLIKELLEIFLRSIETLTELNLDHEWKSSSEEGNDEYLSQNEKALTTEREISDIDHERRSSLEEGDDEYLSQNEKTLTTEKESSEDLHHDWKSSSEKGNDEYFSQDEKVLTTERQSSDYQLRQKEESKVEEPLPLDEEAKESPKCEENHICDKAGGQCISRTDECKGDIVCFGCKGNDCLCCVTSDKSYYNETDQCTETDVCSNAGGACAPAVEGCNGQIIKNGCNKRTCSCCVPYSKSTISSSTTSDDPFDVLLEPQHNKGEASTILSTDVRVDGRFIGVTFPKTLKCEENHICEQAGGQCIPKIEECKGYIECFGCKGKDCHCCVTNNNPSTSNITPSEDSISSTTQLKDSISNTTQSEDTISDATDSEDPISNTTVSEDPISNTTVSEDPISNIKDSEDPISNTRVLENTISNITDSENPISNTTISEYPISNITNSEDPISNTTVSEDPISNITDSENPISNTILSEDKFSSDVLLDSQLKDKPKSAISSSSFCKPKNRCNKLGGQCISITQDCEGEIICHGCTSENCMCCIGGGYDPKWAMITEEESASTCKENSKCQKLGGKCLRWNEQCRGEIVCHGCYSKYCTCCLEDSNWKANIKAAEDKNDRILENSKLDVISWECQYLTLSDCDDEKVKNVCPKLCSTVKSSRGSRMLDIEKDLPSEPQEIVKASKETIHSCFNDTESGNPNKKADGDDFNLDLFRKLALAANQSSSLFVSPYSFVSAFILTYFGSAGKTEKKMREVLHVKGKEQAYHAYHNFIQVRGTSLSAGAVFKGSNNGYIDKNIPLHDCIPSVLPNVKQIDINNPSKTAQEINEQILQDTNWQITDLVTPEDIHAESLLLVNAAYFKGIWTPRFKTELTTRNVFYDEKNMSTGEVDMMNDPQREALYVNSLELESELVGIPCGDSSIAMFLILPWKYSNVRTVLKNLTPDNLNNALQNSGKETLDLSIPKFKMETKMDHNLRKVIKTVFRPLFSKKTDLSGFSDAPIHIHKLLHKAVVDIAEEGDEDLNHTPSRSSVIKVKFDRPFVYLIRDTFGSGTTLFAGVFRSADNVQPI